MGGSLLDGLKARRQELLEQASTKDVPLPGWDSPALALRMHPLDHSTLRKQANRVQKAAEGARALMEMTTSAAVIAEATEVVLIGDDDASELPLRDPDLLASLDLEPDATDLSILRALALGKDGVVLQLAAQVQRLSGYAELETDRDFSGE